MASRTAAVPTGRPIMQRATRRMRSPNDRALPSRRPHPVRRELGAPSPRHSLGIRAANFHTRIASMGGGHLTIREFHTGQRELDAQTLSKKRLALFWKLT